MCYNFDVLGNSRARALHAGNDYCHGFHLATELLEPAGLAVLGKVLVRSYDFP